MEETDMILPGDLVRQDICESSSDNNSLWNRCGPYRRLETWSPKHIPIILMPPTVSRFWMYETFQYNHASSGDLVNWMATPILKLRRWCRNICMQHQLLPTWPKLTLHETIRSLSYQKDMHICSINLDYQFATVYSKLRSLSSLFLCTIMRNSPDLQDHLSI